MATIQKCCGKGSSAPGPVPKGKIRIYSMRFCPYAQRARLVLNAKGIEHETVNINLSEKPEWFIEKNPLGTVPTLETSGGDVICESTVVCEYLDEAFPGKKLFPADPLAKAQQKMLLEDFSKVLFSFFKTGGSKLKGEDVSASEAEIKEQVSKLNQVLVKKNFTYIGGDSVTMIDYLIWPWFERLESWKLKHCLDGLQALNNWILLMEKDPAVKATMHDANLHTGFITAYMTGKPNYDYGL